MKAPPLPEMRIGGYFAIRRRHSKLPTSRGEPKARSTSVRRPAFRYRSGDHDMLMLRCRPRDGYRTHLRHLYFHPSDLAESKRNVTAS